MRRCKSERLEPLSLRALAKDRASFTQKNLQYEYRQELKRRGEEVRGIMHKLSRLRWVVAAQHRGGIRNAGFGVMGMLAPHVRHPSTSAEAAENHMRLDKTRRESADETR